MEDIREEVLKPATSLESLLKEAEKDYAWQLNHLKELINEEAPLEDRERQAKVTMFHKGVIVGLKKAIRVTARI